MCSQNLSIINRYYKYEEYLRNKVFMIFDDVVGVYKNGLKTIIEN